MKSLKENVLLGALLGVLLAQVACGGGVEPPETPCEDAAGVLYPCPVYGMCNSVYNAIDNACNIPCDGSCCINWNDIGLLHVVKQFLGKSPLVIWRVFIL